MIKPKRGRPSKPATESKTVRMALRMTVDLRRQFEDFARQDDLDLSDVLRAALRQYAERRRAA